MVLYDILDPLGKNYLLAYILFTIQFFVYIFFMNGLMIFFVLICSEFELVLLLLALFWLLFFYLFTLVLLTNLLGLDFKFIYIGLIKPRQGDGVCCY